MGAIRIVIADDHPIFRAGLQGLLSAQEDFEVVGEAANGREAIAVVRHAAPDVLLVDLQMPELDGVGAIREIRAVAPGTRILVLTTYDSDADILRAVEAGATGYLLKDTPREELFKAIRDRGAGPGGPRGEQQAHRQGLADQRGDRQDPPSPHLRQARRRRPHRRGDRGDGEGRPAPGEVTPA